MRKLIIFIVLLQGCVSITDCDYNLTGNGWYPALQVPQEFVDKENRGYTWFTNDDGDFFGCPELKGKSLCGGLYAIYEKESGDSYKYDKILCIE